MKERFYIGSGSNMNSDDKFEILNEIDSWEKETKKLENSDEDESEQILEI